MEAKKLKEALSGFCGTMEYHAITVLGSKFPCTDGVLFLAQEAGAFWLMDAIASHQAVARRRCGDFQVWTLRVNPDTSAVLECRADSNTGVQIRQEIEFTDFPLDEITLWVEGDVLLLPSEH